MYLNLLVCSVFLPGLQAWGLLLWLQLSRRKPEGRRLQGSIQLWWGNICERATGLLWSEPLRTWRRCRRSSFLRRRHQETGRSDRKWGWRRVAWIGPGKMFAEIRVYFKGMKLSSVGYLESLPQTHFPVCLSLLFSPFQRPLCDRSCAAVTWIGNVGI